jgi:hypothetical protein
VTDGEVRIIVKRVDDAVHIMTENANDGSTMIWSMDGASGVIQQFNGNCWQSMSSDTITMSAGDGTASTMFMLNAKGAHLLGANFFCGTMGGHFGYLVPPIGSLPGVPPAAPALSVVVGPTGMAGVASAKWTMTP